MQDIDLIAAKSDYNDKTKWLPYKIHNLDTEGIIELLYDKWLSKSVRSYISKNLNVSYDIEENDYKAKNLCRLIALIHDIGKITPAFQSKITSNIENHTEMLLSVGLKVSGIPEASKSPHNIAGQFILEKLGFPKEISVIVGSHHGRASQNLRDQLSYSSNYYGRRNEQEQEWHRLWTEWIDYALKKTDWTSIDELPKLNVKVQMIITGLLIMSDWIASNTNYFPYIDVSSSISDEECCKRVKYAWNKLNLPNRWDAEKIYDLPQFFKERFSFDPNFVQKAVMDAVSGNTVEGLYILEAPMGIGKTEAALAAAEILASTFGAGGIYFGLPTQATANGIFGRIRDWAKGCDKENHTIRLAHGMTELNEEYQEMFRGKATDSGDDGVIVHEWFEGRKQALLADFVIATVDQFLLASLKQKHVMLRHLGLSGKVVIIDECHAYDAYMNVYLDRTLTWMGAYKVPVIVLSATLPPQRRNELVKAYLNQRKDFLISSETSLSYPVITWTSGMEVMQKAVESNIPDKHITVNEVDELNLITVLSEKLSDGGCAAVIVNTVGYAQQISEKISVEMSDFSVICFHSRFTAADRAAIEKKLLAAVGKKSSSNERNRLIIVGTQVIEQSLDLDFDFMVTELCPMDLLLQRSGRLHRHNRIRPDRLKNAELTILRPAGSKSSIIYSEWILKRTEKYLPEELVIPKCIPYLVSKVYDVPENDEERGSSEWKDFERVLSDKKTKAEKYCIRSNMLKSRSWTSLADFLDDDAGNNSAAEASVRDTDETIEVIVMQKKTDNICCLPASVDSAVFDTTLALSDEEARLIAIQRLKLPLYFSQKYNFNNTFNALDVMPKNWRASKWLDKELLLILDENSEAELIGKKLRYSKERGLEIVKEQGRNMEREFNLIDEPWICVRTYDLTVKEVSLKEVFLNAPMYIELAGETKSQDFAVLRLLLAIMYTVFSRYDTNGDNADEDIPDFTYDNWVTIWEFGRIPNEPIERYFGEWYDRFWLFDEKYPFYQSNAVNGKGSPYSTAKMIGSLFESGNKPRLFSDRYNDGRLLSYSEAARWLLHINCFDDIAAKKPTPKRTWVGKLSLIAVKGENLFETLMLNYNATYDSNKDIYESHPSWETDNNTSEFNHLIAIPNNQAALLSLQSRSVYLCRENGMVSEYYISGGDYFEEDDVKNEQMTLWKSYQEKKDSVPKHKPKLYDISKKAWQEFGSIAAFERNPNSDNTESHRTPGIMECINFLLNHEVLAKDYMIKISTAAVIYDYKQATSLPVIDTVSDELTFHSQLLLEIGSAWRKRVNDEIENCSKAANAVYFLYKNLQNACGRTDKDSKTEQSGEINAKMQFYDMIDRPFRLWLAELKTDYDMDEYCAKLESELRRIALKLGNELAVQTGDTSIFGRYKKKEKKNEKEITSSAEALNIFASQIGKIFKQAGDDKNE